MAKASSSKVPASPHWMKARQDSTVVSYYNSDQYERYIKEHLQFFAEGGGPSLELFRQQVSKQALITLREDISKLSWAFLPGGDHLWGALYELSSILIHFHEGKRPWPKIPRETMAFALALMDWQARIEIYAEGGDAPLPELEEIEEDEDDEEEAGLFSSASSQTMPDPTKAGSKLWEPVEAAALSDIFAEAPEKTPSENTEETSDED